MIFPSLFVFDVAGTTVLDDDDAVGSSVCSALATVDVEAALEMVNPLMGMPKPLAIKILLEKLTGSTPAQDLVEKTHSVFQKLMIQHYQTSSSVEQMPGAVDLFKQLQAGGCKVGLDTGFDRPIMKTIIQRLGWEEVIDDSVTSDEVANGRPDPEMIHVLMERASVVDAERVWKAGDSVSDIEQGLAAGCGKVFAVLSDRTRPVVDQYPGVIPIETLGEVSGHLQPLASGGAK